MKNLLYLLITGFAVITIFWACEKEETPKVDDFQIYVNTAGKNYQKLESSPYTCDSSKQMRFLVKTRNDVAYYVTMWPGQRSMPIIKSKLTPTADSVFNGKPVYTSSNNFEDYGIPKATGIAASRTDSGYVVNYTYPRRGSYKLVMLISNGDFENAKSNTKSFDIVVK